MAYKYIRPLGVGSISLLIVFLYVQDVSLDFAPISGYFDEIDSFDGLWKVVTYSFFGNMVAGVPFHYVVGGGSDDRTLALYLVAAGLRSFVVLYFIPARFAVFYIFSSFMILELNQARLSMALSFLFIFMAGRYRAGLVFSGMTHFSLVPLLPLYLFKPRRMMLPFFVLVVLAVIVVGGLFPRYFAGSKGSGVPLNTYLYFLGAAFFYFQLWRRRVYVHDYLFFLFFAGLIFALTQFGFSSIYVGRIAELSWHIGAFRFLLHYSALEGAGGGAITSRNKSERILFVGCFVMLLLGLYRVLLIERNIWSYF